MLPLLVVILLQAVGGIKICGNFCGPDWCNGRQQSECNTGSGAVCTHSEQDCDESVPSDGSCEDECCKNHDRCCGSVYRTPCNDAFYSCLDKCSKGGGSGKFCFSKPMFGFVPPVPVPAVAIKAAMQNLLKPMASQYGAMCCGHPCNASAMGGTLGRAEDDLGDLATITATVHRPPGNFTDVVIRPHTSGMEKEGAATTLLLLFTGVATFAILSFRNRNLNSMKQPFLGD